ncbi:hypothetical protein [Achromobacter pestifer]
MKMERIAWVDQRLTDWARWLDSGGGGYGCPAVYDENRVEQTADVRAGLRNTDPALDLSALDTDCAVAALPADVKRTVIAAYRGEGGQQTIAERLGITRATLHRRLCHADRRIDEWFEMKKQRAADIRNNLNYATYT